MPVSENQSPQCSILVISMLPSVQEIYQREGSLLGETGVSQINVEQRQRDAGTPNVAGADQDGTVLRIY